MVIGIVRKAVWPVGPALIELTAYIEPSTLGIWRIVPDMCPVGIQMLLEGCQGGRENHMCRECIPAVHYPHRKCRSPHPAFGPRLLDLERVAPSGTSFDEREKVFWIDVDAAVKQLVHEDHVTSLSPVVERGQS